MSAHFSIQSSDPALLEKATQLGETFAQSYIRAGIAGIAFLGALARGYFDAFADIDVLIFKNPGADIPPPANYIHEQGFEIHASLTDIADEQRETWDMAKRWAFSTHRIVYDPRGQLANLFAEKVVLRPDERRWLMIEGMTQSNWYCDQLPRLWSARGNLVSAHHMFDEGVTHFLNALYGLNNQLVADVKWRYYWAEQLPRLPARFRQRMQEVLRVSAFTAEEASRRSAAFLSLWREVLPQVEAEVGLTYEAFSILV